MTVIERIRAKVVEDENGCWNWTGSTTTGYGTISVDGRSHLVHRLTYAHAHGPVPDGLEIDHLCRNRSCCNPAHLEAVTCAENVRRGLRGVLTTHCPQGHAYDEANTSHYKGHRRCRACGRARARLVDRRGSLRNGSKPCPDCGSPHDPRAARCKPCSLIAQPRAHGEGGPWTSAT